MKYAYSIDAETEASRNFDFMLLLGALLFLSSNSTAFYIIHIVLLIHISLKFHKLSLCLFVSLFWFQWVSPIILVIEGSKIAKFPCKKR